MFFLYSMAKLQILGIDGGYKGIITKADGSVFELFKGDTIKINGKTAKVTYFKNGLHLMYEDEYRRSYELKPEELDMVEKVVGGRKSRRKSRKNKSRRYRRV